MSVFYEIFRSITCSWHQKTKPQIHRFTNLKCRMKARESFKPLFLMIFHFKPCFFILKTFCSTLNSWICELENLWFRFLMSRTGYKTMNKVLESETVFQTCTILDLFFSDGFLLEAKAVLEKQHVPVQLLHN